MPLFILAGRGAGVVWGEALVAELIAKLAACVGAGADEERVSLAAQLDAARAALAAAVATKAGHSAFCALAHPPARIPPRRALGVAPPLRGAAETNPSSL